MKNDLDFSIKDKIIDLNNNGYITLFSCSGVPQDHDPQYMDMLKTHGSPLISHAYLAFKPDSRLVEVNGWIKVNKELQGGPAVVYYIDRTMFEKGMKPTNKNIEMLLSAWNNLFSTILKIKKNAKFKKIAWPWIGTTEHEMGSMSKSYRDTNQAPYEKFDTMVVDKSLYEGADPSTQYAGGIVSPVDGNGQSRSLADDGAEKSDDTDVDIYILNDDEKEIAKFKCNVAKTLQEKINGLQVYSNLKSNYGLLFEYADSQDVLYHMGTVKFAIDIIFLNKDKQIKKICKNIKPGDLGTFGCSNVKYVLEVNGGLTDGIGIKIGNKIRIDNIKKSMIKSASVKKDKNMSKIIYVYNFDGIISRNPNIKISKAGAYSEDNVTIRHDGLTFTPGESITISANSLNKYPNYFFSKTASGMKDFLENSQDTYDAYRDLKDVLKDPNNIIIMSTAFDSAKEVVSAFLSKLEVLYGSLARKEHVICKIARDYNHINIIEDLRQIYPDYEIRLFADDSLSKRAGSPVPSDIKEVAKKAIVSLDIARQELDKSISAIKQNLIEYEKIQNDPEKIKGTQGLYHQSTKRNVETAKKYLISIRDAIKILNEIKDATTTMEIIEALASSAYRASEAIQEIFDLINKMSAPDFVPLLSELTKSYEKVGEDLEVTIDRAKDYINTNILGIIILST